jgi:hypothetical protein
MIQILPKVPRLVLAGTLLAIFVPATLLCVYCWRIIERGEDLERTDLASVVLLLIALVAGVTLRLLPRWMRLFIEFMWLTLVMIGILGLFVD